MRLIWNGHSCFTLETAGGTVVVDPYLDGSVPGLAPIRLRADAVYCSHDHRDHGARELVALTGEKPDMAVETITPGTMTSRALREGPIPSISSRPRACGWPTWGTWAVSWSRSSWRR